MKPITIIITISLFACNQNKTVQESGNTDTTAASAADSVRTSDTPQAKPDTSTHANRRFRNVTVKRLDDSSFRIRGQGQIFEASFSWVVEDGHYELYKGYQMTDAGAPEWGNFDFTIHVQKKRENSTLTLILFESSPKDGSRQYELPIALY